MIVKRRRIERGDAGEGEENLKIVARGFYFPKRNPKKPQGEDATFICEEEKTMGVADGVGGWANHGIDAGEYARELLARAAIAIQHEQKGFVDPRRVLNEAFLNTKAKGSSTASIITLKKNLLHGVNVGDSGLMLFRNNKCLFQLPIQQHSFNRPYQLGNSETSDRPNSVIKYQIRVEPGDIIVFGSDGLLDNMYPCEIEQVLRQKSAEGRLDSQELSRIIVEKALCKSMDKHTPSPFALAALMEGYNHEGGNIDDITVIVAHIIA